MRVIPDARLNRRHAVAVILAAGLPAVSSAMFARLTDEQLISQSDLIVLGEWAGQSAVGAAALGETVPQMDMGVITIAEVLKGTAGQVLALVATPSANGLRSGSDILHKRGERGLWLLRLKPGAPSGIYLADHPQRYEADPTRIEALRRLLKR